MKKEYDFSAGRRGAILSSVGKTRITIYLDNVILGRFKSLSRKSGKGYQTLINEALAAHTGIAEPLLTPQLVRQIIREELLHQES